MWAAQIWSGTGSSAKVTSPSSSASRRTSGSAE